MTSSWSMITSCIFWSNCKMRSPYITFRFPNSNDYIIQCNVFHNYYHGAKILFMLFSIIWNLKLTLIPFLSLFKIIIGSMLPCEHLNISKCKNNTHTLCSWSIAIYMAKVLCTVYSNFLTVNWKMPYAHCSLKLLRTLTHVHGKQTVLMI